MINYSSKIIDRWSKNKYSMFIHWGLYSIPAGIWNGKKISGYSEQIKGHAKIETEEYRKLALQFNPQKWDPYEIAKLAKENGLRSIVICSKHHDGFCLFHSKYTKFNVVDSTPYKKDILKELSIACCEYGLNFGIYFSLIDWDYEGANPFTSVRNSDPIPKLHHQYNLNQIEELLTNYGEVSEFWFDMGSPTAAQSREMRDLIKKLQPNTLISGRIWNDQGDFAVMSDNYTPDLKLGVPWQTPASIFKETWGYRSWQERGDLNSKICEKIEDLVKIVSFGGNYLLNIGPKEDGSIVKFEKDLIEGVGGWIKENRESIYETLPTNMVKQDWGYTTKKGNKLFIHIRNFPNNNLLEIKNLNLEITKAYPLSDHNLSIRTSVKKDGLEIDLSNIKKDKFLTTIALEFDGNIVYKNPKTIYPDKDGITILNPDNCENYYSYSGHDYYSNRAVVVKLKWYLSKSRLKQSGITVNCKDKTEPLNLRVNEERYPIFMNDRGIENLTIDLYNDRSNEIEIEYLDRTNPHKELNLSSFEIVIG
ncbi:MAG: alpha-L-fucosidase [Candidatus Delongbacteria bacterium]|nr:MAG: alpha-L-fucosidase [Candidatus Delongbacteria bacterium]